MGLAASQARYLALTARKGDLEFQAQTINSRRIQLAYKTAEVARAYSEGISNQKIKISYPKTTTTGKSETVWEELNFENLYEQGFMIIGTNGAGFNSTAPYQKSTQQPEIYYIPTGEATNISADQYLDIKDEITPAQYDNLSSAEKSTWEPETDEEGEIVKYVKPSAAYVIHEYDEDGKPKIYKVNPSISAEEYKYLSDNQKKLFTEEQRQSWNWEVTPTYGDSSNDMDLQSLLVSGTGHIVTKAFFDYLVSTFGYNFTEGISPSQYQEALEEWSKKDSTINPNGTPGVIDWRSDVNDKFKQLNYTEDDEEVLAKYEADTAQIQAQDKILEMEEKNIETQHKAVETELEGLKKVIETNIDKTFKLFS